MKPDWTNAYGKLPLSFEVNQGQTAPDVRFLAHGQGYQLFLTSQEAVLTLRQPPADQHESCEERRFVRSTPEEEWRLEDLRSPHAPGRSESGA